MKNIRLPLTGLTVTLLLVVAASLTTSAEAQAQDRASVAATARVVDAGPGWMAHAAGLEQALTSGQFAGGAVMMTEYPGASVKGPRPVVVTDKGVRPNASEPGTAPGTGRRTVTIYVEHVAN